MEVSRLETEMNNMQYALNLNLKYVKELTERLNTFSLSGRSPS